MMQLPDPVPEPGRPHSPEPSAQDLRAVQIRMAQALLAAKVDYHGIRAESLARLAQNDVPGCTDAVAEWGIYKMLESNLLRLVIRRPNPSPHSGHFYAGPLDTPPPVCREFVQFSEQVVAPTAELWPWLQEQESQTVMELSEREKEILKALRLLNAIGKRTKVSRLKAAKRVAPDDKPSTFNHAIASLVRRQFVMSQTGQKGGIWLTSLGLAVAQKL